MNESSKQIAKTKIGELVDRFYGSHHIFKKDGIPEFMNLQNDNGEAKPYQIRQFLSFVEKYGLRLEESA